MHERKKERMGERGAYVKGQLEGRAKPPSYRKGGQAAMSTRLEETTRSDNGVGGAG